RRGRRHDHDQQPRVGRAQKKRPPAVSERPFPASSVEGLYLPQLEGNRERHVNLYGLATLLPRHELRRHHSAKGFFVTAGSDTTEYLGIRDVALLVHDELNRYTTLDVRLAGDGRIVDLLLQFRQTADQFGHVLNHEEYFGLRFLFHGRRRRRRKVRNRLVDVE